MGRLLEMVAEVPYENCWLMYHYLMDGVHFDDLHVPVLRGNIQDGATVGQYPTWFPPTILSRPLSPMDMFRGYGPFQCGPRPMRQNSKKGGTRGCLFLL